MKFFINFFKKKKWMGVLLFALAFFGVIYFVLHYNDFKEGVETGTPAPTVNVSSSSSSIPAPASVSVKSLPAAKAKIISHIENSKDKNDPEKYCASMIASNISADKDLMTYFNSGADKTNYGKFNGKTHTPGTTTANNVISLYPKYFTGDSASINKYTKKLNKTC